MPEIVGAWARYGGRDPGTGGGDGTNLLKLFDTNTDIAIGSWKLGEGTSSGVGSGIDTLAKAREDGDEEDEGELEKEEIAGGEKETPKVWMAATCFEFDTLFLIR